MGKRKIRLEGIEKEIELPPFLWNGIRERSPLIYDNGSLENLEKRKLEAVGQDLSNRGYQLGKVNLGDGRERMVVMKNSLIDALGDPSSNAVNEFRDALRATNNSLSIAFGKRQIKPCESAFEENLFKGYLSSLMMCLVKYPYHIPNREILEQMGLHKLDIAKLYTTAAAAWLGTNEGVSGIGICSAQGIVSCLENVSYTGSSNIIDFSLESCRKGSHYTLIPILNKKVIDVQKNAPEVQNTGYLEIESRLVRYIKQHALDKRLFGNPRNMIRVYLNMACLHNAGKPIPLEWNKKQ